MTRPKPYLIIGQGLAGSILAWRALQRGCDVQVIDRAAGAESSRVAAGLFTPVTGKRFVLTWMAETLLPASEDFFRQWEKETGVRVLHQKPTLRIFQSPEEEAMWNERKAAPALQPYLLPQEDLSIPDGVHAPHGGFLLTGSGWVDIPTFLDEVRKTLIQQGRLIETRFHPMEGLAPQHSPAWKNSEVIWCEGWRAAENPIFSDLPFRNAAGDILTVHCPGLSEAFILSSGFFILPIGGERFRIGATFRWENPQPNPCSRGRKELEAQFRERIHLPYEVLNHQAGIRPVATQRVPVLGRHPTHPGHSIFNGLGAKGVVQGPWFADHLLNHLETGHPLLPDVALCNRLRKN